MALSWNLTETTTAAPTTTTSVAPTLALPDNCIQVVIYNGGANTLLVSNANVAAGTVLTAGSNAFPVASGGTLVLGPFNLASRGTLIYSYAASGGATTAYILYQNQTGAA